MSNNVIGEANPEICVTNYVPCMSPLRNAKDGPLKHQLSADLREFNYRCVLTYDSILEIRFQFVIHLEILNE